MAVLRGYIWVIFEDPEGAFISEKGGVLFLGGFIFWWLEFILQPQIISKASASVRDVGAISRNCLVGEGFGIV